MQNLIAQQLKAMYDEVLSEPIPPRLVQLLEQLDQITDTDADSKTGTSGKGS